MRTRTRRTKRRGYHQNGLNLPVITCIDCVHYKPASQRKELS